MKNTLPLALQTVGAIALAFMASGINAQTIAPGRMVFDQNGCQSCHAYSSRRGAPSVRDMLATFQGEPGDALKGISRAEIHKRHFATRSISEKEFRAVAEWISGSAFPEPEAPIAQPSPQPAVIPSTAAASPAIAVPVTPAQIAAPVSAAQALPLASRRSAPGRVNSVVIEPGKSVDQLILNMSGRQPEELDIQTVDGKLVIRMRGTSLASDVATTINAAKSARAVASVQSIEDNGTLTLTVSPRDGDLKYNAIQGRNRLLVELTTVPSKRNAAALPSVPVIAAPTAVLKPAGKPVEKPAKQVIAKADGLEKQDAEAKAALKAEEKAKLEARAKLEAETKAKKEADALALAKKEADAKVKKEADAKLAQSAAKKASDDKVSAGAAEAATKELEMMAAIKASAAALQGSAASSGGSAEAKGRKDRSKMKAPDKFRDEPCPPLADSEPIGNVDETRAKSIIDRVGCPQCHAFVQKKTGPPFKRVFEKVKGNPSCVIKNLKKNKEHNDEGVTDDLKGPEFKIVADYIATRAK